MHIYSILRHAVLISGYIIIIVLHNESRLYMLVFSALVDLPEDYMFSIGDKIVYPMHGAGVIESIEEKEILGQKQSYYIVKMPIGDMRVMIPIQNTRDIGIREVISHQDVDKVFDVLLDQHTSSTSNWNKRYRENMIKIKSGNIFEVADVVRTLILREKEKGLSTGEKKMLNSAKQILISELVLAKDLNQVDIEVKINECFEL